MGDSKLLSQLLIFYDASPEANRKFVLLFNFVIVFIANQSPENTESFVFSEVKLINKINRMLH